MLLFTVTALVILLSALFIHYYHHFRFQICKSKGVLSNNVVDNDRNIYNQRGTQKHCVCRCKSVDDEEFDFFPISFLFYTIFMTLLTVIICVVEILSYLQNENENIYNLFFAFSIKSYHHNSLFELHRISLIHIFDYILVYGVCISSIWESLFSFYRFYTTYHAAANLQNISTQKILTNFAIYAIVYTILFMIEIHAYYWIFIIIVLIHSIFNFYCNFKFASVLIDRYKVFADIASNIDEIDANLEILHSVYFMKWASLICCVLQSVYLTAFIVTYNVMTIRICPIIWALNCLLFTFNFIRNRQALKDVFASCKPSQYIIQDIVCTPTESNDVITSYPNTINVSIQCNHTNSEGTMGDRSLTNNCSSSQWKDTENKSKNNEGLQRSLSSSMLFDGLNVPLSATIPGARNIIANKSAPIIDRKRKNRLKKHSKNSSEFKFAETLDTESVENKNDIDLETIVIANISHKLNDIITTENEPDGIRKMKSIQEAIFSLEVLSKHGFCYQKNLTSMSQFIHCRSSYLINKKPRDTPPSIKKSQSVII